MESLRNEKKQERYVIDTVWPIETRKSAATVNFMFTVWIDDKVTKFNTTKYMHESMYFISWIWAHMRCDVHMQHSHSNVQRAVAISECTTCKMHTWNNWTCKSYLRAHARLNYDYDMNYGIGALTVCALVCVHLCSRAHYRVPFHSISFHSVSLILTLRFWGFSLPPDSPNETEKKNSRRRNMKFTLKWKLRMGW